MGWCLPWQEHACGYDSSASELRGEPSAQNEKWIEDVPIILPVFERTGPVVASLLRVVVDKGEAGGVDEASLGDEVAVTRSSKLSISLVPGLVENSFAPQGWEHWDAILGNVSASTGIPTIQTHPSPRSGGLERSSPDSDQDPRDADQARNTDERITEGRSASQIISQGRSESQRDQQVAHEQTRAGNQGRRSSGSSPSGRPRIQRGGAVVKSVIALRESLVGESGSGKG